MDQKQNQEQTNATVIAIANQKGGVAKTTTTINLGIGLAKKGKTVLLIDSDPQASLTISLGFSKPDDLPVTLPDVLSRLISDLSVNPENGILSHPEGVDLMPGCITLSGLEVAMMNCMSRETILKQYLEQMKHKYDYILIDCMPSLGVLTINALAAADKVMIPAQAHYLSAKGLEQLLATIGKVRRQLNPKLMIEGVLLTMVDARTNYEKAIRKMLKAAYGDMIRIYPCGIPRSVRASEASAAGISIYRHDPKGAVAEAYQTLTKEILGYGQ